MHFLWFLQFLDIGQLEDSIYKLIDMSLINTILTNSGLWLRQSGYNCGDLVLIFWKYLPVIT